MSGGPEFFRSLGSLIVCVSSSHLEHPKDPNFSIEVYQLSLLPPQRRARQPSFRRPPRPTVISERKILCGSLVVFPFPAAVLLHRWRLRQLLCVALSAGRPQAPPVPLYPSYGRMPCRSVPGPPRGGLLEAPLVSGPSRGGPPEAPLEPLHVGFTYVGRSAAPRGPS